MRTLVLDFFKPTKKLFRQVNEINKLEESLKKLTDEQLKAKTTEFKQRLQNGATLDDIKLEAFAVVREASIRTLNMRHYDVQLLGGLVLHEGKIAEMQTGEGKTLVASLPSYLNALEGKGVHVITANEYLARRDYETIGKIHRFLGLEVGLTVSQMSKTEKQQAYQADITYGTGNEFGFDYLRDNMVFNSEEKVQRKLNYSIIDEIDSILIDEARTPLIIANKLHVAAELYEITAMVVKTFEQDVDYEFYRESKQILLKEEGAQKIERTFGIENLYDLEHQVLLHSVMQALHAHYILKKDVDYIVKDGKVQLVDAFTGRIMEGRTFSDGLHQAIEAKEGVQINEENITQASITVQNYFRMYKKLSGMTGSAMPSKDEFNSTYGLEVVEIPTNKPKIRIDHPDLVFATKKAKLDAVINEVKRIHATGRPILIGTTSIWQSEELSTKLNEHNIAHQLLNAKSEEDEARLIAKAGEKGQITIATNMAGRGTDIILGKGVAELGGLHIIGTQRHESKRIDMQLRGRSGRQGDPGSSQFITSLEDDIMELFDEEALESWRHSMVTDSNELIIKPNPVKFMNKVQETVEGFHFSARSHLLKLDNVADEQRKVIYEKRDHLLESEDVLPYIIKSIQNHVENLIQKYCLLDLLPEEWNWTGLLQELSLVLPNVYEECDAWKKIEERDEFQTIMMEVVARYQQEIEQIQANIKQIELKNLLIKVLDYHYIFHLDQMAILKDGVNLRSYGQEDPYRVFAMEGYELFEKLMARIDEEVSRRFLQIYQLALHQLKDNKS